jgi:hypothetical protein
LLPNFWIACVVINAPEVELVALRKVKAEWADGAAESPTQERVCWDADFIGNCHLKKDAH